MMFGVYGPQRQGHAELPRVLQISIARYRAELPRPNEPLEFLVSIHEEGTGLSWQQNVRVALETERRLIALTAELNRCSLNWAVALDQAKRTADELGALLYQTFIGTAGAEVLGGVAPTAVLLGVDETILNLPWELIGPVEGMLAQASPLGRVVTTRTRPRPPRDPLQEDARVRILAIENPTADLAGTEDEIAALRQLEGERSGFKIEVELLDRDSATRARFSHLMATGNYDVVHFSGHAALDAAQPGESPMRFADGDLSADEILRIPWKQPPAFVFNSACESAQAVGGLRLVSPEQRSNGLAGAFLTAGVQGYAGFFWPVTPGGAARFTGTFYDELFRRENVGLAFQEARRSAIRQLAAFGDLTGYSAVLFGDAASKHRRDLASAQ